MTILRVFGGAGAHGNPCEVIVQRPPSCVPVAALTRCYTWEQDSAAMGVTCYTAAGEQINCCGHGLLAAAQYWLDHGAVEPLVLGMGASRVQAYRRGGSLWLDFAHLAVANTAVPGWVAQFFPCPPASAATTGEPQGYLLLQWPDDFPLQTLPVPGVELGQVSDCALIAWSRCSTGDYSLRYRYFAPQYGVAEDSATGSAMRVLADYCWQYYAMQEVTARQCSPRGGLLLAKADAKGVSIGGKVNTVSMDRAGTRC